VFHIILYQNISLPLVKPSTILYYHPIPHKICTHSPAYAVQNIKPEKLYIFRIIDFYPVSFDIVVELS